MKRHLLLVVLVILLAAVNEGLVIGALATTGAEVTSGSGSGVTNGWIISGGIALTFLVVVGLQFVPLPHVFRHSAQALALAAQAMHSAGHLFRWYYRFPHYDDILHAVLTAALAVMLHAAAIRPLRHRDVRPARTFVAIVVFALAAAALWEIFEYSTDSLLGTHEQDDLQDTMQDIIDGTLGGTLFGFVAAWANAREQRKNPKLWDSDALVAEDETE